MPWFVLAAATTLTIVTASSLYRAARVRDEARFARVMEVTRDEVLTSLERYVSLIRGGAGFFAAVGEPTQEQFERYVLRNRLAELYPGIRGIGIARRTRPEEVPALADVARGMGESSFRVWPRDDLPEMFPIVQLLPQDAMNRVAMGFDMFQEPVRAEAMARARDQGRPAASKRVVLVQESAGPDTAQAGFVIYVPVYESGDVPETLEERRATLKGFVYGPFRWGDLLDGIRRGRGHTEVAFEIYEGPTTKDAVPLYSSEGFRQGRRGRHEGEMAGAVAGVEWEFVFFSTPDFDAGSSRHLALIAAVFGGGLSIALFRLTMSQARAQRRAERITFDLRASQDELSRSQVELSRHRDRLEELVVERTQQLDESHRRLRQADRLAAIGTLAAGIGHDMGNLLLPIRLRLDILARKDLSDAVRENLEPIEQSADYLQKLTNGLRLLALDPDDTGGRGASTSLNSWWGDVSGLLRASLGREQVLHSDLPENLPPVAVAPHRLTQAVLNLIGNAGDAIRSANKRDGEVRVTARLEAGPMVALCVEDNGPGMSEHVRARALEPFFTTKTRTFSTGLGLALVHGIVESSGGRLTIDSQLGRGTSVCMHFPPFVQVGPGQGAGGRPVTALLTIQTGPVRSFLSEMLTGMGLRVLSALPAPLSLPSSPSAHGGDEPYLWITDADRLGPDEARRCLENPRCRIIAIGELGSYASLKGGELKGIVNLPKGSVPSKIIRAAEAALKDAAGVPIGSGSRPN
ncbi:MAG: CHASE domain-containing protein [Phycisphaerales bacterium]|nr:CHASE domain-containing protein [Phycisphaerales bacterium]